MKGKSYLIKSINSSEIKEAPICPNCGKYLTYTGWGGYLCMPREGGCGYSQQE